jgi:DNA-binding transcriptional ArsR family regulator
LANVHRLQILCALSIGELSVGDLQTKFELSQSALSQHLAKLRAQKLVETRRSGRSIYYHVADGQALDMAQALLNLSANRPSDEGAM